jgi:hypothetical protein
MIVEPVAVQDFLLAVAAGGVIVLAGAVYALLFAVSRIQDRPALMPLAYAAYAVLAAAVFYLARAAHFSGFWTGIAVLMVVGYLLAPHGVWRLCVGTHEAERGAAPAGSTGAQSSETRQEGKA